MPICSRPWEQSHGCGSCSFCFQRCGVNLPEGWTSRELFEDWFIDDPDGQPTEKFRLARDEIKRRVRELLDSIKVSE